MLKSLHRIGAACALLALCSAGHAEAGTKRIAILLFDGADIIDFAAPEDVFINAGMEVFTVSPSGRQITAAGGLAIIPSYGYANAPEADAVLIPGGDTSGVVKDPATLAWIKQRYEDGDYLLSVCNGAFTLANTGLLKALKATTTSGNIDALRKAHPEIEVTRKARVVDNGRIITTGGYSAGIDGALHLVARLASPGRAQTVAELMEYDARPEGSFLPATHGFHVMHQTLGDENLTGFGHIEEFVSSSGDAARWSYAWKVRSDLGDADLAGRIDLALAEERKEMEMNPPYAASPGHQWRFVDSDGRTWSERLDVSSTEATGQHLVTLSAERVPL